MAAGSRRAGVPTSGADPDRDPDLRAAGALDGARDLDPGADVELVEEVADVALDGLGAEVELGGDLGVGAAVDDQLGDLELARGQRGEPGPVGAAGARAP